MTVTINKGENFIIRRDLFMADGTTPLMLSSIAVLTVDIVQANKTISSFTYPSLDLRLGVASNNQVELEVTTSVSNLVSFGKAKLVWNIRRANTDFIHEGSQLDILVEDELIIIK